MTLEASVSKFLGVARVYIVEGIFETEREVRLKDDSTKKGV